MSDKHTPGPWKLEGWSASDSCGWTVLADQRITVHAESSESEANARRDAALEGREIPEEEKT